MNSSSIWHVTFSQILKNNSEHITNETSILKNFQEGSGLLSISLLMSNARF